jgi:DNA-binding beta-propeller fold protein YncE
MVRDILGPHELRGRRLLRDEGVEDRLPASATPAADRERGRKGITMSRRSTRPAVVAISIASLLAASATLRSQAHTAHTAQTPRKADARSSVSAASARPAVVIDRPPVRVLEDANPTFNAIAIDADANEVFISNNNKASTPSILVYPTQFPAGDRVMEPRRRIAGPVSRLGDVCGVALSPQNKEIYTVQGEEEELKVFPLDGNGDLAASRSLSVSHGSADVFLDAAHDELFISTEHINRITVYRRTAKGSEPPLRYIQGPHTGIADPHGLYADPETNELFVTNYGNYRETLEDDDTESNANEDRSSEDSGDKAGGRKPKVPHTPLDLRPSTGRFVPPFIAVYARTASGDVAPLRVIQGPHTGLNLPLGIRRDPQTGQILVANSGGNAVLFFDAKASGDAAPVRVLQGAATNLKAPTGVAIDDKRDELWVTSWENHTTSVFPRTAAGNVAPLRFIRSAAKDAPAATFGTPGAIAWDAKRREILVPN